MRGVLCAAGRDVNQGQTQCGGLTGGESVCVPGTRCAAPGADCPALPALPALRHLRVDPDYPPHSPDHPLGHPLATPRLGPSASWPSPRTPTRRDPGTAVAEAIK